MNPAWVYPEKASVCHCKRAKRPRQSQGSGCFAEFIPSSLEGLAMTVGITNKTGACASTSASRASGVLLALLLVLFLFYFPSLLFAAEDQADIVDQQRLFLDQAMHNIDLEREQLEAEKKAKAEERLKFQKKRTERRLVEQLKGLSGTLSGLPELPSFSGKFESQGIDPRLATQSND